MSSALMPTDAKSESAETARRRGSFTVGRAASALTLLLGLWLVALVIIYSMFERADAAEKVTDSFRDTVSARGLDQLESDYGTIRELGVEYIGEARPAIASQLGMTTAEYDRFSATNLPAIARAVRELPPAVALVDPVLPQLRAIEDDFASVDAIPGAGLPATSLPWLMLALGGAAAGVGIVGLRSPGRRPLAAALILGTGVVAVAFAFSLPGKLQAAHRTVVVGRVGLSQKAADTAARAVANVDAMVAEVDQKLIPLLAQRLGQSREQVQQSIASSFPGVARGLERWPTVEPNARALAKEQGERVDDFQKGDGAPFRTLPWLVIGPCLLVALMALAALLSASPPHRERHA